MSTLLSRTAPVGARELDPRLTHNNAPRRRPSRAHDWFRDHVATISWLTPIVIVAGFVNFFNFTGSPAISSEERTITMQAWAVGHLGQLSPYTYDYSHPPLGWLQIAAWTGLSDGFARYGTAVFAAREAMVVATLVSVVVLWFVVRRLGFGRAGAGVAPIVFALSPLAVDIHRTVSLANVASPWLLVALLLATSRRNQLRGFAGSAVALGIAVLSCGSFLIAAPLVAAVMWRSAVPETRRYALSVAATTFILTFATYVMFALARGQLIPSGNHPSLIGGLFLHAGSDSHPASSVIHTALAAALHLDPALFFGASAAALAGLFIKRVGPFVVAFIALVGISLLADAFLDFDRSLSETFLVLLLPIAAIVVAGVVDRLIQVVRSRATRSASRIAMLVVAVALTGAVLVPTWLPALRNAVTANHSQPAMMQAERWIDNNVSHRSRLIVDNSMWVELVSAGFAPENVVWYPKLDSDPVVRAQSPNGWKDSDYVVITSAMRSSNAPSTESAIHSSVTVASFGAVGNEVEVRRIVPAGAAALETQLTNEQAQRAALGNEISSNPAVKTSVVDTALLRAGQVDPRIPLLLAQLAASGSVTVSRLPSVAGEDGFPIRKVVISSTHGQPLSENGALTASGRAVLGALHGPFAAQSGKATRNGLLVEFPLVVPAGIIQ